MDEQMNQCPVCESTRFIKRKKFKELELGDCSECGLGYATPLVEGEQAVSHAKSTITSSEYYTNIKQEFEAQSKLAAVKAEKMLTYYRAINPAREISSILEIGCGTGAYCSAFESLGVSWRGLEVNPEMVEFANRHDVPVEAINIMEESIEGHYDIVFLSQVLEHVIDPVSFLQRIKSSMSAHSILHLDVPNHDALISVIRKYNPFSRDYGFLQPYHHLVAYNKAALQGLLLKAGFEMLEIDAYANDHPVMGQLLTKTRVAHTVLMRASDVLKRGSLLVAVVKIS